MNFKDQKLHITGDNPAYDFARKSCLLLEQDHNVEKSIREALKAAYLVVRYANTRTQFQTLEEK